MKARSVLTTSSSSGKRLKEAKALRSPVARMILAGGVIHVPLEAYLRRLQRLVRTGHINAHGYSLYPGIAHVAVATDARVALLFRTILSVSEGGRHLQGLESLFLSCLQGLETTGRSKLALAGLAAWTRFKPAKHQTPLVVVERRTNQFKFIPLYAVEKTLTGITSKALLGRSVWDVLTSLEQQRAGAVTPGGFNDPRAGSDADDGPRGPWTPGTCRENVTAFVNYAKAGVGGIGAAVGMGGSQKGGLAAGLASAFVQIADAFLTDVAQPIANFACDTIYAIPPGGGAPDYQDPYDTEGWLPYELSGNLNPGQMPGGVNDVQPGSSSTSTPGASDNTSYTDPEKEWNEYPSSSDGSSPPPPPPGDGEGTPNPEDDNGHYSMPPGSHGPWPPGGELPNPDDVGGGPTSFPNGVVFVPVRTIRALALVTRTSATSIQVGGSQSGVATFQLSVNSSALGSGPG